MSVTFPKGFQAAGVAAGLKASGKRDVAVVVNTADPDRIAAGAVFTSNRFQAAPVQWSRRALASRRAAGAAPRAVVLNSGGANACTGQPGCRDSARTAAAARALLGLAVDEDVLVCSTGLIGEPLPMDKLLAGVAAAVAELGEGRERQCPPGPDRAGPADSDGAAEDGGHTTFGRGQVAPADSDGGARAAEAILTTDTHAKTARCEVGGVRIGGMAKGAGMLAPGLATMLVVVTTDAVLTNEQAQQALDQAVELTFNRIDSDGCMSTNDTVILMSSGCSGVTPPNFTADLARVCHDLAMQLIGDAEGASHDISIEVRRAASEPGALEVARAISRSNLFKTAIFGNDPNWGRVLSAAGTVPPSVAPYDPDQVDVSINGVLVCRGGQGCGDRDLVDLSGRRVEVVVDLAAGQAAATLHTNDLTHDYVHENSAYST
ncbi:MAG: bifunctional ornithine acetyltransferase/N-acetylglutamate synthase [Propionibacteriaceae bacterium]|nr:bifunctional ornithine acetyltransferase/N-acetylglutamate synthase [Propionibacteriaceae bacterium]